MEKEDGGNVDVNVGLRKMYITMICDLVVA
jgi:hypothetical protein